MTGRDYNLSLRLRWLLAVVVFLMQSACESDRQERYFEKTIAFSGTDVGRAICRSRDEGYVICGQTNSIRGNQDILVLKTDRYANIEWAKTFGGNGYNIAESVYESGMGNYFLTGRVTEKNRIYLNAFSLNPQGNLIWTRYISETGDERGSMAIPQKDEGMVVIGSSADDILLVRLNKTGNTEWIRTIGKTGRWDVGTAIADFPGEHLIVSGQTNSYHPYYCPFIIETTPDGQELSTRIYNLGADATVRGLNATAGEGIFLTGYLDRGHGAFQAFLLKTDYNGVMIFNVSCGPPSAKNLAYGLAVTADKDILITGATFELNRNDQVFVEKYTPAGERLWSRTYGGTGYERGYGIQETHNGDILIVGTTRKTLEAKDDIYLLRVNAEGLIVN